MGYPHLVSIPFKRESGSKEIVREPGQKITFRVSIPFKRESGSKALKNGIGEVKQAVSIPFKRESGSKGNRER